MDDSLETGCSDSSPCCAEFSQADAEMPSSSSSFSIFDLIWPSKLSRFGENLTSLTISFAFFTVSDNSILQ